MINPGKESRKHMGELMEDKGSYSQGVACLFKYWFIYLAVPGLSRWHSW